MDLHGLYGQDKGKVSLMDKFTVFARLRLLTFCFAINEGFWLWL